VVLVGQVHAITLTASWIILPKINYLTISTTFYNLIHGIPLSLISMGCSFSTKNVLQKTWEHIPLIKQPKTTRIPDILTTRQINQLLVKTEVIDYRVFFFTSYSMGRLHSLFLEYLAGNMKGRAQYGQLQDIGSEICGNPFYKT